MGKDLKSFNGAVLYIDLLGFGALTKGQIPLTKNDLLPWLKRKGHPTNHQFLAAEILVVFRKILIDLNIAIPYVKVSQLSDCAFVWSNDIKSVLTFSHKFMHRAIKKGVFIRGGLAFGEIIETEQNHNLGRLIVGNAVSNAVELEGLAKGSRILINQQLPTELYLQDKDFANVTYQMFQPFTNLLDYHVYDEFKWYLTDNLETIPDFGLSSLSIEEKIALTKKRLKLANLVQHSELFSWNATTNAGSVHLQATSNFLSENYLLNIFHCFEGKPISKKRNDRNVINMDKIVDEDSYFKLYTKPKEYECGD